MINLYKPMTIRISKKEIKSTNEERIQKPDQVSFNSFSVTGCCPEYHPYKEENPSECPTNCIHGCWDRDRLTQNGWLIRANYSICVNRPPIERVVFGTVTSLRSTPMY